MIFGKGKKQTYLPYFKREFAEKRENSGVLARFVLLLPGIGREGKKFLKKLSKSLDKDARKIYNVRELAIRATEC